MRWQQNFEQTDRKKKLHPLHHSISQSNMKRKNQSQLGPKNIVNALYLYIKDAKSFFDVPREKLSPRPFRPRQDNLKVVKGFHSHGVHNILCVTKNL
jgi:hypothetical protein